MIDCLVAIVSRNLHSLVSEQTAQATKQGRSFIPPAQLLGVNVRPAACLLEPGPLTYLFGLGFLQPTKKRRFAAGHGELPDIVMLLDVLRGYHQLLSGNVS